MNKLFSKIATLSVGLAMAVGVGVALGQRGVQRVVAATDDAVFDQSNTKADGITESPSLTKDGNGRGRGASNGTDFTLTTDEPFTNVTKVVVNAASNAIEGSSLAVSVGGNAFGASQNLSQKGSTDYTFSSSAATGVVVVSATNGSKSMWIKTVTITYETVDYVVESLTLTPSSTLTIDGENEVTTKQAEVAYAVNYTGTAGQGKVDVTVKENDEATTKLVATPDFDAKKIYLNAKRNGTYVVTVTTKDKNSSSQAVSRSLTVTVQNLLAPVVPQKINSATGLKLGDKLYLVDETHSESIGDYDSTKCIFTTTDVVIEDNKITDLGTSKPLTVGRYGENYLLKYENDYVGVGDAKTTISVDGTGTLTWNFDFEEGVTIVSTNESAGSIYYNYNNGNSRFSNYVNAQTKFSLFLVSASDQEVANEFMNNYMHMSDYTENKGWCSDTEHDYYDFAKYAFKSMSAEQKDLVSAAALERLAAWARANGEQFDTSTKTFVDVLYTPTIDLGNNAGYVVIIAVITVCALAFGVVILTHKRKHQ